MAARRMIASDINEDDFVGSLKYFGRLLWIGMIVSVADDQGRLIDNPAIVRAKVFPYDTTLTDDKVEEVLAEIIRAGKVIRYTASGKGLLQIVNWWKYQTPSWASPSKYSAPKNWVDRIKYHTVGNKIVILNWELPGGLQAKLCSKLPSAIEEGDVNDDVKDDGDDELTRAREPAPEIAASAAPLPPPALSPGQGYFLESFNAKRFKNHIQREAIFKIEQTYGMDRFREVVVWAATKGLAMGPAIAAIEKAIPKWGQPKPNGNDSTGTKGGPPTGLAAIEEVRRGIARDNPG